MLNQNSQNRRRSRGRTYPSRFQPQGQDQDDPVSNVQERGGERFGSWDGDPNNIPGAVNRDGTPDMRDDVNREAFLGETTEDRAVQRSRNLTRGVEQRYGGGQGGRQMGSRSRSRFNQPRQGQQFGRRRFQQSGQQGGGQDLSRILDEFERIHNQELEGLQEIDAGLERASQSRFNQRHWNNLVEVCQEAQQLSQQEGELIQELEQVIGQDEMISELEEVNQYEQDTVQQLLDQCEGQFDWSQVERICDELYEIGQKEGQIVSEIEQEMGGQGWQQGSQNRQGYQGRQGQYARRQGQIGGQSRYGRRVNTDGSPDLRDPENRNQFTMQRYGKPGSARTTTSRSRYQDRSQ